MATKQAVRQVECVQLSLDEALLLARARRHQETVGCIDSDVFCPGLCDRLTQLVCKSAAAIQEHFRTQ